MRFYATLFAGLVLVMAGCTMPNQQASNSPAITPSELASPSPTPSTAPTPSVSPTPESSPTPRASPSPAKLIISSLPFHLGEVGVAYGAVALVARGGVLPYKWSLEGGALPPGVVLSTAGQATGKPATVGTFSFVIRVDDSAGAAAGAPSSIRVFRQIAFIGSLATCSASGNPVSCTTRLNYTGGVSSVPRVTVLQSPKYPPLPKGSTFTAKSGVVTVTIPGPVCNAADYDAVVSLVLVDQSPCGAGFNCSSGRLSLTIHLSNNC